MLTSEDRDRCAALPRDEHGLRPQDPDEQRARDAILWRCARLAHIGIRVVLPPIARRTR